MCIFHKWSKWEDVEKQENGAHIHLKQRRDCEKCGIGQYRNVVWTDKVKLIG